ncbi:hypothetical protein BGZ91_011627 [Linnemannia elongata]|nr:hypothetical protein BGZ91_011627 [Linnemannia elongata]
MSSYQSTSSEADEAKLEATTTTTTNNTTKKRARSSSQGGQSSQDEHLHTAKRLSATTATTTTTTTTAASSSSTLPTPPAPGAEGGVSPAVNLRKEQNRAAQRAFRDRKERHLQQLENLIQDLKDQQFLLTTRFQREIQQLKVQNQVVVHENQYLREVVFAFESALNYRGDMEVLQDVKQGLYRRYVGRQVQQLEQGGGGRGLGTATVEPQEQQQQQQQQPPPPLPPKPVSPPSLASSKSAFSPALQAAKSAVNAIPGSSTTASAIPSFSDITKSENQPQLLAAQVPQQTGAGAGAGAGESFLKGGTDSPPHLVPSTSPSPPVLPGSNPSESAVTGAGATPTPYSINREILYRAPASLQISELNSAGEDVSPQTTIGGGLLAAATTPLSGGGGVVPLSPFFPAGTPLPKITEYTKHPTVFDELQSSLFPPGTLQSVVSANMASPQDVVNDTKLFDQLDDKGEDSTTAPGSATTTNTTSATTATSNGQGKRATFSSKIFTSPLTTPTKSSRTTTKTQWTRSELLNGVHRLQKSFKVLAAGPLKVDPKIDPQIYQIPHDARIDLIPCPKLRAQMILHQHKYNMDEVFQLLVDKAICHGSPLNPRDWELPEEFFERFGFLIGVDLENQRRKVWPRPLPPDMEQH